MSEPRPLLAYVLPFGLFMALTALEAQPFARPYYPALYTLKVLAVFGAVAWGWRRYPAWSARGFAEAVVFGVVGTVVWVALASVSVAEHLPGWLTGALGLGGARTAYRPFEEIAPPAAAAAFVGVRLLGLAIMVPLMEETFWRGFLLRWLVRERFEEVPQGTFAPLSFGVVTVAFTLVHPELLAALVWGAGINALYYRTKNLWACVVAHAVTNALLGAYVLTTGRWELW